MSVTIGRITARLAQPADQTLSPDLVKALNANVRPPKPLSDTEVYIAAMYVASDEVNSFGGRFPPEEHARLARLLIDSPVLAGHRKDTLPIGRNFHAQVVDRQEHSWVKSYFYWLRSDPGADHLRANIDGGIYKECSIGFTFHFPECSICGRDIRDCPHEPFQRYDATGDQTGDFVAHFNYRRIERVLETSLVYRGAVAGTRVSRELADGSEETDHEPGRQQEPVLVADRSQLRADQEYLLVPHYDSLPVCVTTEGASVRLRLPGGSEVPEEYCARFETERLPRIDNAFGQLVGYRGRERCAVEQLVRHLGGRPSAVTHLEVKLFPPFGLGLETEKLSRTPDRITMIRYCVALGRDVHRAALSIMTRQGVRLWPADADPSASAGFLYRPQPKPSRTADQYTLVPAENDTQVTLALTTAHDDLRYHVHHLNLARLARGCRFLADRVDPASGPEHQDNPRTSRGRIRDLKSRGDGLVMQLSGILTGTFVLQPVELEGKRRCLFYQVRN